MNRMMAYCGIICEECPAYKATVNNNDELRKKTADRWSKMYNDDIRAEHINCLGCRSELRFSYCGVCEVRVCNLEKQLGHCGDCDAFSCGKEDFILDHTPGARERLEAARGK